VPLVLREPTLCLLPAQRLVAALPVQAWLLLLRRVLVLLSLLSLLSLVLAQVRVQVQVQAQVLAGRVPRVVSRPSRRPSPCLRHRLAIVAAFAPLESPVLRRRQRCRRRQRGVAATPPPRPT
jgi:hypothetical protein